MMVAVDSVVKRRTVARRPLRSTLPDRELEQQSAMMGACCGHRVAEHRVGLWTKGFAFVR